MIPITAIFKKWGFNPVHHPSLRGFAWLLLKLFLFVVTFLAVWLLNINVAGSETSSSHPAYEKKTYWEIAWAAGKLWRARPEAARNAPPSDVELMRVRLYDLVMGSAAASGPSRDSRRRMEAVSRELFERKGFRVLPPPRGGYGAEHLLIDPVLRERAGSPLSVATIYLAICELLSPPIELNAMILPGSVACRFQDGANRLSVIFSPENPGRIIRGELPPELQPESPPDSSRSGQFRILGKGELAGALLGELARVAVSRDEKDSAIFLLNHSVNAYPERLTGWLELSRLTGLLGDPDLERSALDKALEIDPRDPLVLARRGELLRKSGDLDGAERDVRRAMESDSPRSPELFLAMGNLQRDRGHPKEAIDAYRRYLATNPPVPLQAKIHEEIEALELQPYLDILKGSGGYPAKFKALQQLSSSSSPSSTVALIGALRDKNLRFARLVWRTLQNMTGEKIEFDAKAWEDWWSGRERGVQS